ncbi:hypothetical protein J437_LFUL002431 [Ladona fulva]|uniref:Uncharacterized protein n=1 Tax=Ladona fulva TaxID=123851 RepID=A0A8K0KNC9_LADFU|nr:hypothetical protein J437_LFUL002431 [Ladona fulva]
MHLVTERFIWPSVKKDCKDHHVSSTVGDFPVAEAKFVHIHLDFFGLFRLVMVSGTFSPVWTASAVGLNVHIRFTTDQGRQFQSDLFCQLMRQQFDAMVAASGLKHFLPSCWASLLVEGRHPGYTGGGSIWPNNSTAGGISDSL